MSFWARKSSAMKEERVDSKEERNISLQKAFKTPINKAPSSVGSSNLAQSPIKVILKAQDVDSATVGVCWNFKPIIDPLQKRMFLDIRTFSMAVVNVLDGQFPSMLALRAQQLSGKLDAKNQPTHIVAVAMPQSIASSVVAADISAHSVIYALHDTQCLWDITGLTQINFYLTVGDSADKVPLPLPNDVVLEAAILRIY